MAKNSNKLTGTLEAEKAGSKLSGLLADEKEFDRRTLWRIGWWGLAALGTVIVAVLANQGAQSWRHDRMAAADLARQTQSLQSLARDTQNDTRRLAAAIETLNSDRDRLYARVTVLEQSLESVTGALAKQGAPQAALAAAPARLSAASPSPVPAAPPTQLAAADPQASASTAPAAADVSAPLQTAAPPSGTSISAMVAAAASLPPVPVKSIVSPFDAAAAKAAEPEKAAKLELKAAAKGDLRSPAALPAEANPKPADATEAAADAVRKTEFAVDLGGANSVNGLRALWRGLAKTNSDLSALQPIIMVKEGNTGLGMQLRLGAGPLTDAAAAARICASLSESQRPCETTVYDGQRLVTRDDNGTAADGQKAGANAAGTAQRRRVNPQRHGATREPQTSPQQQQPAAAAPPAAPEQPKPAEPATLSSLFRRPQ